MSETKVETTNMDKTFSGGVTFYGGIPALIFYKFCDKHKNCIIEMMKLSNDLMTLKKVTHTPYKIEDNKIVRHGLSISYDPNENKKISEYNYDNGYLHGSYKVYWNYYQSGNPLKEGEYIWDKEHGTINYYNNSILSASVSYQNGYVHGEVKRHKDLTNEPEDDNGVKDDPKDVNKGDYIYEYYNKDSRISYQDYLKDFKDLDKPEKPTTCKGITNGLSKEEDFYLKVKKYM